MPLLLLIDTAVTGASICLARDREVLAVSENMDTRDSAAWLQPAIRDLLMGAGFRLQELDAVAVSAGPGSYTGLRVGMATAKGLCFALGAPLIALDSLQVIASAALPFDGYCVPMIDARRMEVFTAVYDTELRELKPQSNLILQENSFIDLLEKGPVHFCGNGSEKFSTICKHPAASFLSLNVKAKDGIMLAFNAFENRAFADLAYTEPRYGKEFYTPAGKNSAEK